MKILIDERLKNTVRVGVLIFDKLHLPTDDGETIWQMLSNLGAQLHQAYQGKKIAEVDGVQMARSLYRSIGLDPTKTRPSSEALLRRSMKGKGLYRIHPLVDLLNYVSLHQLIPVGLYDVSKIVGDEVRICIGEDNWGFDGIRKARVNVGGRLCVVDHLGPFGSPTSDSLRTSIEGHVASALVVLYLSTGDSRAILEDALRLAASLLEQHMSGRQTEQYIL